MLTLHQSSIEYFVENYTNVFIYLYEYLNNIYNDTLNGKSKKKKKPKHTVCIVTLTKYVINYNLFVSTHNTK